MRPGPTELVGIGPVGVDLTSDVLGDGGIHTMPALISLSDREGILGVFTTSLPEEIEGHPGPIVAQAWPTAGGEPERSVWVIPTLSVGHPPLLVTDDHDMALRALNAFSSLGAAPPETDVDAWCLPLGSLTPPAKRRMSEHLRTWTDDERAKAQSHFDQMLGIEAPTEHIPGSVVAFIVEAPPETDEEAEAVSEVPAETDEEAEAVSEVPAETAETAEAKTTSASEVITETSKDDETGK